jgi:hypothetical protein
MTDAPWPELDIREQLARIDKMSEEAAPGDDRVHGPGRVGLAAGADLKPRRGGTAGRVRRPDGGSPKALAGRKGDGTCTILPFHGSLFSTIDRGRLAAGVS